MSLQQIFQDITDERSRQDEFHPDSPAFLIHPSIDPKVEQIDESLRHLQEDNNTMEKIGQHSWYGIAYEEQKEVFSAKTLEDLYSETIQAASVYVRLAQDIKAGKVKL